MDVYKNSANRLTDGPFALTGWIPIPLTTMRETVSNNTGGTATDGIALVLNLNSTPTLTYANGDTDSALRLTWVADGVDPVVFQTNLPPFLDHTQNMTINVLAEMGGTTDSLVLAADTYFNSGDTKVEDNSGTVTGTTEAVVSVTIAAADIPEGARTMTCELTPGAHANDTLVVHYVELLYSRLP